MRAASSSKPSSSKVTRAGRVSTGQPCATRLVLASPLLIVTTDTPSTPATAARLVRNDASRTIAAEWLLMFKLQRARIVRRDMWGSQNTAVLHAGRTGSAKANRPHLSARR
jgi:hypothetical protein